jgi:hypothetical protein
VIGIVCGCAEAQVGESEFGAGWFVATLDHTLTAPFIFFEILFQNRH